MENYDIEKLKKQIFELQSEIKSVKKYGLIWDKENTKEQVVLDCEKMIPLLEPVSSKTILNGNTNNILIQGDNFHSLASLNYISSDSVDVIYIDPPYNTGNNDFIYNDKFINLDDGYVHSKWLNFMSKRLKLAKNLLKNDGVIFISIDDNEFAQLKLLCDSIFGSNNFIQMFLWNKSSGGSSLSKYTRTDYEYVLCYAKNIREINFEFLGKVSDGMGDSSLINKPNKYKKLIFPKGSIYFPNNKTAKIKSFKIEDFELHNDFTVVDNYNSDEVAISCKWKWSQETINEELKMGSKIISKSLDLRLRYVRNNAGSIIKPTKSITTNDGVGYTVTGSSELNRIIGDNTFSYPKPVSLIKYLIKMVTYHKKDAIVFDFFAGSGTTGQACMELNNEDGGKRRFILCTNNENNICDDITYPRLKTVITGVRKDKSKYSEGLKENLFYFKTTFIKNEINVEQSKYNLVEKVDSLLCIKEDIFNEIERNNYSSHFSSNDKHLFIYNDFYNEVNFTEFKKRVLNEKGIKIVYIYSIDNNIDESLFEDKDVFVKPIPSKIYEIYKEIVEEIKRGE